MHIMRGASSDDFELVVDKGCVTHISKYKMYSPGLLKQQGCSGWANTAQAQARTDT